MPYTDQFWQAYADCMDRFPDLASLGAAAADWTAEMARIRRTAFASVLITASSDASGSSTGAKNFPQEILQDALRCRRRDLDPSYELPPHLATFPAEKKARTRGNRGYRLRFA